VHRPAGHAGDADLGRRTGSVLGGDADLTGRRILHEHMFSWIN
jgi:hypothetical protein